jgi:hypothetical protein
MKDTVAKKLRKLKALAQDKSSPNEAQLASDKLQDLLSKHGLCEADLADNDIKIQRASLQKPPRWKSNLADVIALYCDCRLLWIGGGGGIAWAGRKSDLIFAQFLYDSLCEWVPRQASLLCDEYCLRGQYRTKMREIYIKSIAWGACEKLYKEVISRREANNNKDAVGTELIPVENKLAAVDKFIENLPSRKSTFKFDSFLDGNAIERGHEAPLHVPVNGQEIKQITGGAN